MESGWGGGPLQSETKAEELRTNILQVLDGRKPPLQPPQSSNNNGNGTITSSTLAISNYDSYDLADHLAIYLEEEFSVTLEDGSERQVAEMIFRLYETCWNGDATLAHQLMMQAETAAAATAALLGQSAGSRPQIQTVVGAGGELDDDSDDSDDEMVDDDNITMDNDEGIDGGCMVTAASRRAAQPPVTAMTHLSAQEYASQPVFGSGGKRKVSVPTGPVRQLGQTIMEEPVVEMDDDGFAPVKPKGRKKK